LGVTFGDLAERIEEVLPTAREVRRYLLDNPELSGQEYKAAAKVEAVLEQANIPHERVGLNVIGLVGTTHDQPAVLVRGEPDGGWTLRSSKVMRNAIQLPST
jgi:metal-dependent amidase/aminoacylase/carboxypeptidase family protein